MMNKTSPGAGFLPVVNGGQSFDAETAKITNGMDITHGSQFRTVNDHSSLTPLALLSKAPFKDSKSNFMPEDVKRI